MLCSSLWVAGWRCRGDEPPDRGKLVAIITRLSSLAGFRIVVSAALGTLLSLRVCLAPSVREACRNPTRRALAANEPIVHIGGRSAAGCAESFDRDALRGQPRTGVG